MPHSMSSFDVASMDAVIAELQGDLTPETWAAEITIPATTPTELLAANADRKSLLIQVAYLTGIVFLGFDNTVTDTKYFRMITCFVEDTTPIIDTTFRMNDYRGPIWGYSADPGAKVVASEW